MRTPVRLAFALAAISGAALHAQTTRHTLFFPQLYDATSLDATGKSFAAISKFDIAAVTPDAKGAWMWSAISAASFSAMVGDGDNDGIVTEFYNQSASTVYAHSGCLLKREDRKTADRRLLYWSVREIQSGNHPYLYLPIAGGKFHKMRPGDFARIGRNGLAEFFITQDLIMKAAGPQTGTVSKGASALTQDAGGNLYYSPPGSQGHVVTKLGKRVLAKDGSVIYIPASAITYDKDGNVKDVKSSSAIMIIEMGSNAPSNHPNMVTIVTNTKAVDSLGNRMVLTTNNWVTNVSGLAIDPNGGTFTSTLSGSTKHPNLLFVMDNRLYRGTVFTTKVVQSRMGALATINGTQMGALTGKADGSWVGAKGAGNSPTLTGLEIAAWNLNPKIPYGMSNMSTQRQGRVVLGTDKTFSLDFQTTAPRLPLVLLLGGGPAKGKQMLAVNLGALFGDFATAYVFNGGPFAGAQGISDNFGRKFLSVPVPGGNALRGVSLVWQGLLIQRGPRHFLSPPIVTEFR